MAKIELENGIEKNIRLANGITPPPPPTLDTHTHTHTHHFKTESLSMENYGFNCNMKLCNEKQKFREYIRYTAN